MKIPMYKTLITLLALVGLSLTTQAQDLPRPEPPKPALKQKAPEAKPDAKPTEEKVKRAEARRHELLKKRVGLSDEKAKKVEAIARKHGEQQRALKQNVRKARVELRQLLRDESDDQQAYERALGELEAAHRSLQDLRQKRFEDLKRALTPKEQAKLLATMGKVRRDLRPAPERPRDRPIRRRRPGRIQDPFNE